MTDAGHLKDLLKSQWAESAQDWIQQDQSVRTGMLDSWVYDALGEVSGKRVIDIGCGEGRFSRLLGELGADVTGVDITEALVQTARSLGGDRETYLVGDAEDLDEVASESFDLAVSYIVLVDLLNYGLSIKAAFRVLRPGGRFVVCNIHPIRSSQPGGWIKRGDERLFYPVDNYWDEGAREFPWWGRSFVNMHRTLSSYLSAFRDAGFILEGLEEPTPSEEQLDVNPGFDDEFRAPNFIVYTLKKPLE